MKSGEYRKLIDEVRNTTASMATNCSAPMNLWQRHSTACLKSATAIEELLQRIDELAQERESWKAEAQSPEGTIPHRYPLV